MSRINVYVSRKNRKWLDQLRAICENRGISLSEGIAEAVRFQIESEDQSDAGSSV